MQAKRVNIISIKMVKEGSFLYEGRKVNSPDDASLMIRPFIQDSDREQFVVVCLNTKNEPISINTVSVGTLNASLVHPREVFKAAILSNACSVLLFHNHPSGDPTPSTEDLGISKRLAEAGKIMGIEVVDHLIIGENNRYHSLKEHNQI